jgi:hypothetical protein
MTTARPWSALVEGTWLGRPPTRATLDGWIGERAGRTRGLRPVAWGSAIPLKVETAHQALLALGREHQWLMCTTTIALTAELLLASGEGGTLTSQTPTAWPREVRPSIEALTHVRNACCHPAHYSGNSGVPHIQRLISHINVNDAEEAPLASDLSEAWAAFAERRVSEFALRKLDHVGRAFCARHRIAVDPRPKGRG